MKKNLIALLFFSQIFSGFVYSANTVTDGNITITVAHSSAPSHTQSSSWNAYVANAMNWLQSGGPVDSEALMPSEYTQTNSVENVGKMIHSAFKSWNGELNPTGDFVNEYGNNIHSGVSIEANSGYTFSLGDVYYHRTNYLGNVVISYDGVDFSPERIGVDVSGNVYDSGSSDGIELSAFYSVGLPTGFFASETGDSQENLDLIFGHIDSLGGEDLLFSGYGVDYEGNWPGLISNVTGFDSTVLVPEPTLFSMTLFSLIFLFRRKRE
jgi:hypothetical protein